MRLLHGEEKMNSLPQVPEGTEYRNVDYDELITPMPLDWDGIEIREIRLAITVIDEFGTPMNRRGALVTYPPAETPEADKRKLARRVGRMVEYTVLDQLGLVEGGNAYNG